MDDTRLLLLANEADEVVLISALLQDALVRPVDIAWQPKARRLVLLVNRFRWETSDRTRVRAALRIESVLRVQRRDWPKGEAILDLLAVTADGDHLTLAFAAGATIRAEVECVDVVLEDMSAPWAATREPGHTT